MVQLPPVHTASLFRHADGSPMWFHIPFVLKERGNLAAIFRATGGKFTDDVESSDYVVLGRWESIFFDATWCDAQEFNKPIVTPRFVTDSFMNRRLMDPIDYRSSQQLSHLRPRIPSRTNKRPRARTPSRISPKWLRSFKKAERMNSFLWIEALFKANPELTGVALAIRLHEELPGQTVNAWKRFCSHHKGVIETLRREATGIAVTRPTPKDADVAGTEVTMKIEQLDNSEARDFAFVADILDNWNANEEKNKELWFRMERTQPCSSAPSWEEFCIRHHCKFELFFASKTNAPGAGCPSISSAL